jgi:hypothetical protein
MKRLIAILAMMAFLFVLSLGVNIAQDEPLRFNRPEMESMQYFFNEASIKGADIDAVASIAQKLKEGGRQVAAFSDASQTIRIKVTSQEARICLEIINNATFQARHAELVSGMKKKLQIFAAPSRS